MLLYFSIVLVLLFTGYCIFYTYKRKEKLTCMAGMMIAMTTGMMSSIALGVVLGVVLKHDLTISTIIAVLVGMGAGYVAGKPISLMAAMDGMLSGIMGGLMGSMLGVMLVLSDVMVLFIDIIFIFTMSVLIQLIDEEAGRKRERPEGIGKPFIGSASTLILGIILIAVLLVIQYRNQSSSNTTQGLPSSVQTSPESIKDYQIAQIDATNDGYNPETTIIKAGIPTKIDFKKHSDAGCVGQVISKELGINAKLQEGDNYINIKNVKPGTYPYTCAMGMYGGSIIVQ